jgi:F0F1-type ATP synthase delta subunit
MKRYAPADLAKALLLLTRNASEKDAVRTIKRFVELLRSKGMTASLRRAAKVLPETARRLDEAEALHIDAARELSKREIDAVVTALGIDPAETKVVLRTMPDLIGGVRLRRRGRQADATVRGRLSRMRAALART